MVEFRAMISRPAMTEDAARFYTALFAGLTVVGLLIGGVIALVEYIEKKQVDTDTLNAQLRNSNIEAHKPFYDKELDYCLAISAKAAAVASADSTRKPAALAEFVGLSEGPLTIVEDDNVARKVADFERCAKTADCKQDLEALAVNLGHSCRLSMSAAFNVSLAALPDRDTQKTAPPPEPAVNRIVIFSVSGTFQQGYSLSRSSTVTVDSQTGLAVSANVQIANTGELFTGAPVYNTDRMWQWQNQGSLGGSLDFQDQTRTFKNYQGGVPLTNSAYWTPSLGHNITSTNTIFTRIENSQATY
jgi:hypothetical protein